MREVVPIYAENYLNIRVLKTVVFYFTREIDMLLKVEAYKSVKKLIKGKEKFTSR